MPCVQLFSQMSLGQKSQRQKRGLTRIDADVVDADPLRPEDVRPAGLSERVEEDLPVSGK
jgi:hypothetical protein